MELSLYSVLVFEVYGKVVGGDVEIDKEGGREESKGVGTQFVCATTFSKTKVGIYYGFNAGEGYEVRVRHSRTRL